MPKLVTSTMTKSLRTGKVFLDWSQNNGSKTTIAPYSLRGREHPTVAAPRTWDEIEDPKLRHLRFDEVLERVAKDGDLLAPLDDAVPDADRLTTYRSMRDAAKTPEPVPKSKPKTGNNDTLRHPGAPRPPTALRPAPRARRRAGVVGGAQEPARHSGGQSPRRAHRGPSAGIPDVRGHHPEGGVRRREDVHLGHRHVRDREVQRRPARRAREGRRGDRHPARRQDRRPVRADPDRRQELAGPSDEGAEAAHAQAISLRCWRRRVRWRS